MYNGVEVIAEVKTQSPFSGYIATASWDKLLSLANEAGDIVSVHTNPRWGGSFELLKKARGLTSKPLLAKGIHATDAEVKRAVEIGADWVLVVGRIPNMHREKCLIEPATLEELATIPQNIRAVWNARNLSDGNPKKETFDQARGIFKGWLCQASHLRTVGDIKKGADAVLVGTHLEAFVRSM